MQYGTIYTAPKKRIFTYIIIQAFSCYSSTPPKLHTAPTKQVPYEIVCMYLCMHTRTNPLQATAILIILPGIHTGTYTNTQKNNILIPGVNHPSYFTLSGHPSIPGVCLLRATHQTPLFSGRLFAKSTRYIPGIRLSRASANSGQHIKHLLPQDVYSQRLRGSPI